MSELDDLLTGRDGPRHPVSLPSGAARDAPVLRMREAARAELAAPFARLVAATAEPFVQAIIDLESPRMALGRACLIGDAAFVPRPHTAASTAKAASDVLALAGPLAEQRDEAAALRAWEPVRLALGRSLAEHGRARGAASRSGLAVLRP